LGSAQPAGIAAHLWPQSDYELRWLRWAGPNRLLLDAQLERMAEGTEFTVSRTRPRRRPRSQLTDQPWGFHFLDEPLNPAGLF
jgi:hypothetical protein